jgi:hypothetical protein
MNMTKILVALLALGVSSSASALQISFNGDLNNRIGIYTDQAGMYAGSETIGSLTAPASPVVRKPVGESWADLKYRLGVVTATDDQKVKGIVTFEWGSIRFGANPNLGCTVAGVTGATCTTGASVGKNTGGLFSGDGVNTELRFAYIDAELPTPWKDHVRQQVPVAGDGHGLPVQGRPLRLEVHPRLDARDRVRQHAAAGRPVRQR